MIPVGIILQTDIVDGKLSPQKKFFCKKNPINFNYLTKNFSCKTKPAIPHTMCVCVCVCVCVMGKLVPD